MGKNLRISSYIRKPFLIYDFAPDPTLNFLIYEDNFVFFLSACLTSWWRRWSTTVWTSGGCAGLQAVPKLESAPASPAPRGQTFLKSKLLTGWDSGRKTFVKHFWLKIFLNFPPVCQRHRWCTLSCGFSNKSGTVPMGNARGLGETNSWKNLKSKIRGNVPLSSCPLRHFQIFNTGHLFWKEIISRDLILENNYNRSFSLFSIGNATKRSITQRLCHLKGPKHEIFGFGFFT
jgi:hypothetical protein